MTRGSPTQDEVAAAVWSVLATHGFAGLTLRAVAEALGRTTGLLMHRFPTKAALTAYALDVLESRTDSQRAVVHGSGRAALRAAMTAMLPVDPSSTTTNRVWVASWDAALAAPELRRAHAARYRRGRDRLQPLLQQAGSTDAAGAADRLQGAMLGLIVQAVLDPEDHPPEQQRDRVDRLLDDELGPEG